MKTFKELYDRWIGSTPVFFKRIINIGLFCGVLGGGLKVAGTTIPTQISDKSGYLITLGITSATVAKFTVKDDKEIERKSDEILKPN